MEKLKTAIIQMIQGIDDESALETIYALVQRHFIQK